MIEVNPDPDPDPPLPLIDFFRTRPLSARNKVAFIYRADRMNPSAANAFLKTLEEPHSQAKVVMTTSEIGLVLPTIVSRCVCVACELPGQEEVRALSPDALPDLFVLAEGAPGRLEHVLRHSAAYTRITDFSRKLLQSKPPHALALSEEFRGITDDLEDALKCNARAANVEGLRALGASLSRLTDRDDWFKEIAEAHRRILFNGNEGTVLDAMFAGMLLGK
jgi:DNA polymerase-3 subunit delta'